MMRKHVQRRAGATSVEYVVVCAMVCLVPLSAIVVLGNSMGGLDLVSNAIAGEESAPAVRRTISAANLTADIESSSGVPALQVFSLLSAGCIVLLGIMLLSRGRKAKEEEKPETCDVSVKQLTKTSKALNVILSKRSSIKSIIREDWVELFEGNAQVSTYMSRELVTVRPDMLVADAEQKLRDDGFRRVMVMHEDGRMAGVLSRKDISSKQGKTVAEIMTNAPKTAAPDMSLSIALSILLQHRISCLPVVKDGKLVGILSTSDLLIVLQCVLLILSNQNAAAADVPNASSATGG